MNITVANTTIIVELNKEDKKVYFGCIANVSTKEERIVGEWNLRYGNLMSDAKDLMAAIWNLLVEAFGIVCDAVKNVYDRISKVVVPAEKLDNAAALVAVQ